MYRTYSSNKQLIQTTDADGGLTRYAYDSMGNPIVLEDANGNPIKARYNALGQKNYVDDPNMGIKSFTYDSFGQVYKETDAEENDTYFLYDILGRLTHRYVNPSVVNSILTSIDPADATFYYDSGCNGAAASETLPNVSGSDSYNRSYSYDDQCRVEDVNTTIGGGLYNMHTDYDENFNRVKMLTYPNSFAVINVYNSRGYQVLTKKMVELGEPEYIYHEVVNMDARGQLIESIKANGILSEMTGYAPETGQMTAIDVELTSGISPRHHIEYIYDGFGNLERQTVEKMQGLLLITSVENYDYDNLHRLISSDIAVGTGATVTNLYDYDAVGNFTLKNDYVSSYSYGNNNKSLGGNAGPNAVRSIVKVSGGTATYSYDLNGNLLSGDGKELDYNAFNKPLTITKDNKTSTFSYGPDQLRYKQVKSDATSDLKSTIYIDKAYEVISQGGVNKRRAYVGDAIITETDAGSGAGIETSFVHRDRLGSVVTITDENGYVIDNKSYDPFGKPRKGTMEKAIVPTLKDIAYSEGYLLTLDENLLVTRRGFTDHEHLDDAELIHMNGRVYDYNLGRFLSVDPFIQEPGNSQSMNPYSYIMNNPLAGTDPSGYKSERMSSGSLCAHSARIDCRNGVLGGMSGASAASKKNGSDGSTTVMISEPLNVQSINDIPADAIESVTVVGNGRQIVILQTGGTKVNRQASGSGDATKVLEFAGKNTAFVDEHNVTTDINDGGVRVFKIDLVVNEGMSKSAAQDMNRSWNTDVMTDADGNRYQGIANIREATYAEIGMNKYTGLIGLTVLPCTDCNTVDLAPGAKASPKKLGEGYVSQSGVWLPTRRLLYTGNVAGHELGHNLGLKNCSSCDSIMKNPSDPNNNKATLQDIKTLYNGYK